MENELWYSIVVALCLVGIIQAVLALLKSTGKSNNNTLLVEAKRETQAIAQLPLHNPHPQIHITQQGKLVFANPAALRIFKDLAQQGLEHSVLQDLTGEEESREVTFENKTYHQTIVQAQAGDMKSYVIYFYDITDRKWFEREIKGAHTRAEKMRQEAEDAKEARGDFLANMSHELRTPMNGIIGLSDMLVEMNLGGEKQELVEAVNSSARNLLILLNDILDFSKIEAGELTIEAIPFDARKMVKQIESLQKPIASKKGLVMEGHISDSLPNTLIGDPSRLQQILNNLISNALKFTEKGTVSLSVDGQVKGQDKFALSIAVTDTGIGIPKDKQAAIFQKFQQADSSTARKYGGTGLGLSITKDLTELMGGTIAIESEENVGTTFTVTLTMPIGQQQASSAQTDTQAPQAAMNTQAKLLIVDDHPINLLFLRQTLLKLGFKNFDEAPGGVQAFNLFKDNQYDLIIMDCQMPEMDGYEVTKNIRAMPVDQNADQNAPIIIAATADAMQGVKERCLAAGMNDYISKPIEKEKLKQMLTKWLPPSQNQAQQEKSSGSKIEPQSSAPASQPAQETAESHQKDNEIKQDNDRLDTLNNDQQAPAQIENSEDLIDWEHLRAFTDGDPEIEKQVIEVFVTNLKTDVTAMHASLQQKDYKQWDSWVHKLYGSCSHMGAKAMANICDAGQSLSEDDIEKIHQTHKNILIEYKRINAYLDQRKRA